MREIKGDLFSHNGIGPDAICLATNGFVRSGKNVMGKGCAGEAKRCWPGIEGILGALIETGGNHVQTITSDIGELTDCFIGLWDGAEPIGSGDALPFHIVSFPTKPARCPHGDLLPYYQERLLAINTQETYPGWQSKSDLDLIDRSAHELVVLTDEQGWSNVVLPRVGCGAGQLDWSDVRYVLEGTLDDRFHAITFK